MTPRERGAALKHRTRAEKHSIAHEMDSCTTLASQINEYLERFEKSPKKNTPGKYGHWLWHAVAWRAGRYVAIRYIGYQDELYLTREEAAAYVEWLKAGHVGRHFECKAVEAIMAAERKNRMARRLNALKKHPLWGRYLK